MSKRRSKSKAKATKAAVAPGARFRPTFLLLWAGSSILILAAILLFTLMGNRDSDDVAAAFPAEITVQEAAGKREEGAFILDVREQDEWDEYHIPGATLIPLGELASRLNEVPTDQEIVVVCRSGNRSQDGRDILKASGYEQVSSMNGGMLQWRSAGYPVQ